MLTINEMFANTYVIVPKYTDTMYGYRITERYDMSDEEWKNWMRAKSLKPIKKILGNSKSSVKTMLNDIISFLRAEGVRCAVVATNECNMVRNGII